ncbi:Metallo-dependent phosphatase-like protein [Lentinula raphanica]|nr:Metallo-dependent phosphatase-like protein [Lentinula raphanica]
MPLSFKSSKGRVVIVCLRALWVCVTLWYEYAVFRYSAGKCTWADMDTSLQDQKHVLLVADPQIIDHHSYPGRPALLKYLSQLIVDLNLRKNWQAALRSAPDVVFFLGDYMDSGRNVMSDAEYERYVKRFRQIFSTPSEIPAYFIPGNHDVGLQPSTMFSPHARTRYTSRFGPLNSHVSIANHTFVLIDAPGLVEEDYKRHGLGRTYAEWKPDREGTISFVKSFAAKGITEPTILLSHIPLSRPEGSNCGPLRERGTIRRGVGVGYQNTLGKDSSTFLLEHVQPTLIFSGDDHDYCEYTHTSSTGSRIREVTVKSLSMAMGIKKPGYQMLTIIPPGGPTSSYSDSPCFLPDQLGIYLDVYIPLALGSLLVVLVLCIIRGQHHRQWKFRPLVIKRRSRESIRLSKPQHLRRLTRTRIVTDDYEFTLDDSDTDQKLPLPASATVPAPPKKRKILITLFSPIQRLSRLVSLRSFTRAVITSNRRGSFLGEFLRDVRDVAVFPLGMIILISLWTSLDL